MASTIASGFARRFYPSLLEERLPDGIGALMDRRTLAVAFDLFGVPPDQPTTLASPGFPVEALQTNGQEFSRFLPPCSFGRIDRSHPDHSPRDELQRRTHLYQKAARPNFHLLSRTCA